jgi:hypothetical protein
MRFRFSGHESFPCRYTWLPKAYKAISKNPIIFSDDNQAMVELGVGKNMVKAIKFWVQAFGIADTQTQGMKITRFGERLLSEGGLDPFLEDIRTLWLLHWKISSIPEEPLFAWYFLLNQWAEPSFSVSQVLKEFTRESERMERPLSDFTKEQHLDIFLHTYVRRRSRKADEVMEDTLDCPLTELQFVLPAGERINDLDRREPVYEFRQEAKNEITAALFVYCLFDFWQINRKEEATLAFREISSMPGSIGHLFKLSEPDIRNRLESILKDSGGFFEYAASAAVPRVLKHCELNEFTEELLLNKIYGVVSKSKQTKKMGQSQAV